MSKHVMAAVAGAVALFAGAIAGALALTGDDQASRGHLMSDGSTMPGDASSMRGAHTMPDGTTMPGMDMTP